MSDKLKPDLVKMLKVTKFTILIDGSTNISLEKSLCLLDRYVHTFNGDVKTFDLIKLNARDCTSEKLY